MGKQRAFVLPLWNWSRFEREITQKALEGPLRCASIVRGFNRAGTRGNNAAVSGSSTVQHELAKMTQP